MDSFGNSDSDKVKKACESELDRDMSAPQEHPRADPCRHQLAIPVPVHVCVLFFLLLCWLKKFLILYHIII